MKITREVADTPAIITGFGGSGVPSGGGTTPATDTAVAFTGTRPIERYTPPEEGIFIHPPAHNDPVNGGNGNGNPTGEVQDIAIPFNPKAGNPVLKGESDIARPPQNGFLWVAVVLVGGLAFILSREG